MSSSFRSIPHAVVREHAPAIDALKLAMSELGRKDHAIHKLSAADLFSALLPGTTDRDTVERLIAYEGHNTRYVPAVGVYRWAGHAWAIDPEKAALYTMVCDLMARFQRIKDNQDAIADACGELSDVAQLINAMGERADEQAKTLAKLCRRMSELAKADREVVKVNSRTGEETTAGMKRCESLMKYGSGAKSTRSVDAAMKQFLAAITVPADAFDRNPDLMAFQNGVWNLREKKLRPGRRSDMISRISPVAVDREADCPLFKKTLFAEIFRGRREVAHFWLRWMGYGMTGHASEQKILLLTGEGRNGKGVLMSIISRIQGSYYTQPPMRLWLTQRGGSSGGPDEDKAKLDGARLVVSDEAPKNAEFDEAALKEFSGQSPISTSRKNKPGFTFTPIGKLVLLTNVRPRIDSVGAAIWERIHEIQFKEQFLSRTSPRFVDGETFEVDPTRGETILAKELPGVLNMLLDAAADWYQHGLGMIDEVAAAVAEYQEETDALGPFLKVCCETGKSFEVEAGTLYATYCRFQERNALGSAMTQTAFGRALKDRKFGKRVPSKVYRVGLRLSSVGVAYFNGAQLPVETTSENVVRMPSRAIYEIRSAGKSGIESRARDELLGVWLEFAKARESDLVTGGDWQVVPGQGHMRRVR